MHTLSKHHSFEKEIKKSRFVAIAIPVDSPEEALEKLEAVRDPEANHNCWAYKIGDRYRFSDDGEPGGTAGKPILTAIEGQNLDGVLVVITRFFGGIKLGAGGLVRAYGDTAREAIEASGRQQHFVLDTYRFTFGFPLYDRLMRHVNDLNATIETSDFADDVTLTISIRQSRSERLIATYTELTSGKGTYEKLS